jgi:hypothetical protein
VVSSADTGEVPSLVNRRGNRPPSEQAPAYIDRTITWCRRARSLRIFLRGGTRFRRTEHLDRRDDHGAVRSPFGIDAHPTLIAKAEGLPAEACSFLERPPGYEIRTAPRERPERIEAEVVRQRESVTIHALEEMVAELADRPVACRKGDRPIVLRKRLGIDKGGVRLRQEDRSSSFITNDREAPADRLVFKAGDRCDRGNPIAPLKGGVPALTPPVDDLVSDRASMVMASPAWPLKVWAAWLFPGEPRPAEAHRAGERTRLGRGFATIRAAVIERPCRIVRSGRRLISRLRSWTPWPGASLRSVERLPGCWLC